MTKKKTDVTAIELPLVLTDKVIVAEGFWNKKNYSQDDINNMFNALSRDPEAEEAQRYEIFDGDHAGSNIPGAAAGYKMPDKNVGTWEAPYLAKVKVDGTERLAIMASAVEIFGEDTARRIIYHQNKGKSIDGFSPEIGGPDGDMRILQTVFTLYPAQGEVAMLSKIQDADHKDNLSELSQTKGGDTTMTKKLNKEKLLAALSAIPEEALLAAYQAAAQACAVKTAALGQLDQAARDAMQSNLSDIISTLWGMAPQTMSKLSEIEEEAAPDNKDDPLKLSRQENSLLKERIAALETENTSLKEATIKSAETAAADLSKAQDETKVAIAELSKIKPTIDELTAKTAAQEKRILELSAINPGLPAPDNKTVAPNEQMSIIRPLSAQEKLASKFK